MQIVNFILAAVFLLALAAPGHALQTPGGRESSPANEPKQPPHKPKRPGRSVAEGKDRNLKLSTATLLISVTPGDSTINLQGVEYRAENGVFIRSGLTPGKYRIVIHKDRYQNEAYEMILGAGDDRPLNVSLKLLTGILNVAPLLADTEINDGSRSRYRTVWERLT
jgi:hypothetical protein